MSDLEQAFENARRTYLSLACEAPGFRLVETGHYQLVTSNFAHPVSNFAIRLNLDAASTQELVAVARHNAAFRIHCFPTDNPANLTAQFEEAGLEESYNLRLMVHRSVLPTVNPLGRPAERTDLPRIVRFIVANFFWSSPLIVREAMTEIMLAAAGKVGEHFLVEREDSILACATLLSTEGAGGIYNVCVRPEERGRGLGSSLVHQLANLSQKRDILPCLQTDPDLEAWYIQLGFQTAGSVRVFGCPA